MKKYEFKSYDLSFPNLFEEEKNRLAQFLTGNYQIEHIGSTAVPGLGGKGIIDIMIAVPNDQMESISKQAQQAGYIFRPLASTETRLFLRIEYPEDLNRYAEIKKKAAQEANENTEKYKSIKDSVLKEIINKALNS